MAKKPVHHWSRLPAIATRAVAAGGTLAPAKVIYPASGSCSSPVYRELVFRREVDFLSDVVDLTGRTTVELEVRCRQCDQCLRARAALWRGRIKTETDAATRTWFGTLTLAPEHHSRTVMLADRILLRGGERFESLTEREKFKWRHKVISDEFTRYMKRVRKDSGAPLRYCLVAEAHKSGLPHYHMVVHEQAHSHPVRHKTLKTKWTWGFADFKLCDPAVATYVAKYLSKSSLTRVRASRRYGSPPDGDSFAEKQET